MEDMLKDQSNSWHLNFVQILEVLQNSLYYVLFLFLFVFKKLIRQIT